MKNKTPRDSCTDLPLLWLTDIDDTIVQSLDHPDRRVEDSFVLLRARLNQEFIPTGWVVATTTGRSPAMSEADPLLGGRERFPARFAIYNVGTEICEWDRTAWRPLEAYTDHLRKTGFSDRAVYDLMEGTARRLPKLDLRPQERERNSAVKASFYANQAWGAAEIRDAVRETLDTAGLRAHVAVSTHGHEKTFIDILPENAGKGQANIYLARHLLASGLTFGAAVFSGDSGNDIAAFNPAAFRAETGLPLLGIVPSNGKEELTVHTRALERAGHAVFHTSAPRAGGVLEGFDACRKYLRENAPAAALGADASPLSRPPRFRP